MFENETTVIVGSLLHETNTFANSRTTREDIKSDRECFGEELLSEYEGTETEIGGALDVANQRDITLIPSVGAELMPGGLVADELYEEYASTIVQAVKNDRDQIDGILLALHGAMVTEQLDDPEGDLLDRVRQVVGDEIPIVVTLDLHAQVTDTMVDRADALVAYETYPHTDMGDTGRRGMQLLLDTINGDIDPVMAIERPPLLAWAPKQNTIEGPMADLMSYARELETDSGIVKTNIIPGFLSSDIPGMGFTIPVVADDNPERARDTARDLAKTIWERREDLQGDYPNASDAVSLAEQYIEERCTETGPVVLADSGDNPGSGAPADGTLVLKELLESNIDNSGVAIIRDPDIVSKAVDAGVGSSITVTLGGKTHSLHGDPIEELSAYVRTITDGRFTNTGEMAKGVMNDLGRAVLLECGDDRSVSVIITENRLQPFDTEIWRHIGIQPERLDALVVKSKNHFRADYEPIASEVILVNTPGLGAVDPNRFEFSKIDRPKYPLEEVPTDAYPDWD